MTTMTIDLQDDVASALAQSAKARLVPIEQVAAEVISAFVRGEDRPLDHAPWTAEDLEAIQEGLDQIERGEVFTHEEVMASIKARLAQ
jgi:predicted transcriptional regulator